MVSAEIRDLLNDPLPVYVCSINVGEAHYVIARRDGFTAADAIEHYFYNHSERASATSLAELD